jgi:hypothetical protein
MDIIILPKGKDKKHHHIIREATRFFVNKLMGKRDQKKIKSISIKLADSIDYGSSRGDCREYNYTDGTFDIFFKVLATEPLPDIISTLAHETVHAKQAVKGELVIEDDIWNWKGKKMKFKDAWYDEFTFQEQYDKLPWEKEAYSMEMGLAISFCRHYYNSNY